MEQVKTGSARERIMDAAGDVFGRKGYRAATVREICRQAGVNLAAVNYYFGGKQALYREVALDLIGRIFHRYPVNGGLSPQTPAPERLRAFVRAVFSRLVAPGGIMADSGKGRLVARELIEPSEVLEDVVADHIRPTAQVLAGIVEELLGPGVDDETAMRCMISVIGQCFHYAMARPVVTRLTGMDLTDEATLDELAEHITRFSLAGLEGIRDVSAHATGNNETVSTHEAAEK